LWAGNGDVSDVSCFLGNFRELLIAGYVAESTLRVLVSGAILHQIFACVLVPATSRRVQMRTC
jgi:hypothetical protein